MSFASEAREEIARRRIPRECCARAACYGIACFAKYFDKKGLVLQTEQATTARFAQRMFARFSVTGSIEEKQRPSGMLYEFSIREPSAVAAMHALFGTTGEEANLQIDPSLLPCRGCVQAYVGAAFLCSGTVTDPQKEYHLEFTTVRMNLSRDFEALLAEHEFAPHRTRRKSSYLVYVKASAYVEDALTFMGAKKAAMRIMDEKAVKSLRNQVNRHNNCDTANMSKTARANAETLRSIRYLQQLHALEALPEPLQEAARIRLEYPDLSLAALAECFVPPLSKSGLSHRIKKLEAIAKERAEEEQSKQRKEASHG